MQIKRKTINDIILLISILLFSLVVFVIFNLTVKPGVYVSLTVDGEVIGTYSLDEDITEIIENGRGGYNVLVIESGSVCISEANCPDGICSSHRPIKNDGESIVCLPNKLVLTVIGENDDSPVDIVS